MTDDARDSKGGRERGEGGNRLPPPAFPPGSEPGGNSRPAAQNMDGAFISPDDPIPQRPAQPPGRTGRSSRAELQEAFVASNELPEDAGSEDAFISPDEPIPHRDPVKAGEGFANVDPAEVVVTGMGHDAHMTPGELAHGGDPYLGEVLQKVSKLAEALRRRGEAGLRTSAEMDRFEATLRAYCVGYLAGRRAEAPPPEEY